MSSTLIVEMTTILSLDSHPNADRLEIATVKGWTCVVPKGVYAVGDKCIYIPIDSKLPPELEAKLFGGDSKVTLNKGRIKTIKLRGIISQGLIVNPSVLELESVPVGTNISEQLGITKYEPVVEQDSSPSSPNRPKRITPHPDFHKYTDIEHFNNFNTCFVEGEGIVITEKIHGSNMRAASLPIIPKNWFHKLLISLGIAAKYQFVYGSHNCQLDNDNLKDRDNPPCIYSEAVINYQLDKILKPGEGIYGEVYGGKIQKNYTYGCKEGHRMVIFDVQVNGKYLNKLDAKAWCNLRGLPFVPILYIGPYQAADIPSFMKGASVLCPEQAVREGIVISPSFESVSRLIGRKILKAVSGDFLMLKNNSDFH